MPCNKKTYKKLMAKVKREHPVWGLARRKKAVASMAYYKKKYKKY